MDKLYAAPMEGLTGYLWRQVHAELFGPADKYFTPFLSPNATCTFQRKELDEIDQFPLVKDIVGYLKMCHSILPIKR